MAQPSDRGAHSLAACILAGALTLTGTCAGASAAYADDTTGVDASQTMPSDTAMSPGAMPQMDVPDEDVPPESGTHVDER